MKLLQKHFILLIALILFSYTQAYSQQTKVSEENKDYLGMKIPKDMPQLFAPGIVSTAHFEHSSPSISPNYDEIYWSRIELPLSRESLHKVVYVKKENGIWSKPEIASFSGTNSDDGPKFSSGGKRIYFYSRKPYSDNEMPSHDIFFVERNKDKWSEPIKLSSVINTSEVESSISLTKKGNIVFARGPNSSIYFANKKRDRFKEPKEILNDTLNKLFLNITPFINSEGNMLLFGSVKRPDGFGACDLYVCFLQDDGNWSEAVNLGNKINTKHNERFPSLSPDGKFLFFVSNRSKPENIQSEDLPENGLGDIYWVDASFLNELKINI